MIATVVETKELLQTVVASLAAGIGVTATFSIMIFGAARFADLRRDNRTASATLFAVLTAVGLVLTGAGIIFGIVVMTQKS
jgi:hypothetical protein